MKKQTICYLIKYYIRVIANYSLDNRFGGDYFYGSLWFLYRVVLCYLVYRWRVTRKSIMVWLRMMLAWFSWFIIGKKILGSWGRSTGMGNVRSLCGEYFRLMVVSFFSVENNW